MTASAADMAHHIRSDLVNAVRNLANAAATSQAAQSLGVAVTGDEQQLWFLVRALCHEHGLDLTGIIERAENNASIRAARPPKR